MAKVICSYCEREIGDFPGEHDSHGICPKCYKIEMAKLAKERRYIDEQ